MKTFDSTRSAGSAVIVVLGLVVALGILAGSLLQMMGHSYMLSQRNIPYTQALFTAEAGADFTWNEINKGTLITTGAGEPFADTTIWTRTTNASGTTWTLNSATLSPLVAGIQGDSSFTVTVRTTNTAAPYNRDFVIESIGTVDRHGVYGSSGATTRRVRLYIYPEVGPFVNMVGLFGKTGVRSVGNAGKVTSYNSNDGPYNSASNGYYGDVGTLSTFTNGVSAGNMNVYGSIFTGPGGTVGTNANFNMYSGGGRTNRISDSLVATIPDASIPAEYTSPSLLSSGATITNNGFTNNYIVNGDLQNLTVRGAGLLRIKVTGDINMSGGDRILISPSYTITTNAATTNTVMVVSPAITTGPPSGRRPATTNYVSQITGNYTTNYLDLRVEFYVEGNMNIRGNGVVNINGKPSYVKFFGLPTCDEVTVGGTADFAGVVYAPNADVTIHGGPLFLGSVIGDTITLNGGPTVVIDEALRSPETEYSTPTRYVLSRWEEF